MSIFFFLDRMFRFSQWILSKCLNDFDNFLNWPNNYNLCIITKDDKGTRKDETCKYSCS